MVVMALPPARGSGGHSSTISLAVWMSLRRFRAMVISVPIFSVLLRLVFLLLHGGRIGSRRRGSAAFSAALSIWRGCRFPWFRVVSGPVFRARFPARRRPWFAPFPGRLRRCCRGAAGRPGGRSGEQAWRAAFLPFLALVFRSGGGRRRPRAGRKISGPRKTDLCKKSARGYPATGCRVYALGSVQ